jgi:DNA-binding response OmpR family regulator
MAKKLLVIDQNLAVHRLLEFTLSKEGYQITAIEDGLAGLDAAYQGLPDLIMVNSQIEGLPLHRFIQKVRERDNLRETPIILMTQTSENFSREQVRQLGLTDVIKKPLDAMEITATIARCINPSQPAAAGGEAEITASQPSTSSTEDDQEIAQMEEMLGWAPKEQAKGKAAAASGPSRKASAAAPAASKSEDESDLPFELQDHQPAASETKKGEAPSLQDMLLTGADALHDQLTAPPPPPPPPPPEPEASPLDELFASQEPIPVKAQSRQVPTPPPSPRQPQAIPVVAGGSSPPGGLTRQEAEALIQSMVEELTRGLARETVERITKEIVPELAERAVEAEIERLKSGAS